MSDLDWIKHFLSVSVIAVITTACTEQSSSKYPECASPTCIHIEGKFEQSHVDLITDAPASTETVLINSIGGRSGFALKIAEQVLQRDLDLLIVGECSSACFEFLLSSARTVTAINRPAIAVHGSPLMTELLLDNAGYVRPAHCAWDSLQYLKKLYLDKNLNLDFVQTSMSRLGNVDIEYATSDDGCLSSLKHDFEIAYWQPTAHEVEIYLGVKIEGALCTSGSTCFRD